MTRTGPGNDLSMEFDVHFDEYLPSSTASGLTVLIHDNEEVPFPEDGGIMAGTQIKRLALPYADFKVKVDANINNNKSKIFADFGITNSLNGCEKSCAQKHVYKYCIRCDVSFPCIEDPLQRSVGMIAKEGDIIPLGNTTDFETAQCASEVEEAFSDNKPECIKNCPPAYEEYSFSTTVASAPVTTRDYWQTVVWQQGQYQNVTQPLERSVHF
ncbi:degenerin mec-10 [Plakobranchus ocellatus]|uniref:Degenerin mec-10 n=1 Tax=Plakobranchus ocellatus TaxID=259542 RepID=A0AAV4D8U8_9GAST|nr:degenerin mec-10 [Plakobranchus ocellatus]